MPSKINAVMEAAGKLLNGKRQIIIAIDGRCAAGKTTLAAHLQRHCDCNVIHMDDFFLRPEQRTQDRFKTPGGNVDYERFLKEVLLPIHHGESFSYRPYDCHTQSLKIPVMVQQKSVHVVEGSYSCHPALWDYYDLHIFLSVDQAEQLRRIMQRNRGTAETFRQKWIPLEEQYFSAYRIEERCELRFL